MDPEKKSLNFIFPTKYVIPKSLKFSHWPSKETNPTSGHVLGSLTHDGPIGLVDENRCLMVQSRHHIAIHIGVEPKNRG